LRESPESRRKGRILLVKIGEANATGARTVWLGRRKFGVDISADFPSTH
jgi:hypothetical protein